MTESIDSPQTSEQVFELTEGIAESSEGKSFGSFRVVLYGVVVVLVGMIAAVQANPGLSQYLSFLPATGGQESVPACQKGHCCSSASRAAMATASCPSACQQPADQVTALNENRPPAPSMPEFIEL